MNCWERDVKPIYSVAAERNYPCPAPLGRLTIIFEQESIQRPIGVGGYNAVPIRATREGRTEAFGVVQRR